MSEFGLRGTSEGEKKKGEKEKGDEV